MTGRRGEIAYLVLTLEHVSDVLAANGDDDFWSGEASVHVTVELPHVTFIEGDLDTVVVGLRMRAIHVERVEEDRLGGHCKAAIRDRLMEDWQLYWLSLLSYSQSITY